MGHTAHVWSSGDTITADLLNAIENDLAAVRITNVTGGTAAAINAAAAAADGTTRLVIRLDNSVPWVLENTVTLKSNTTLDLAGQTLTAIGGATKFPGSVMVNNADQVNGNTGIRIINGKLDGNNANNGGKSFWGIYFVKCDHSEIAVDVSNTPSRGIHVEGSGTHPKPRVFRLRTTVDNCGDYSIIVTNGMRDVVWDDVVVQNSRGSVAAVYLDASEQYGRITAKFNPNGSGVRFNNVFGHDLHVFAANNGMHGVYLKQLAGCRVRIKSHNNGTLSNGVAGSGYADVFVSDDFGQSYGVNQESTVEFEAGPLTDYGGATDVFGSATEDYALYVADGNSAALDFHFHAQRIGAGSLVQAVRLPATKPGITLTFPGSDRVLTANADFTLTQDAAFNNDTELTSTLPVGDYVIDGYISYESSATADLKVGLVVPSGTTGSWTCYGPPNTVSGNTGQTTYPVLGPNASQIIGGSGAGVILAAHLRGRLTITTAGTVSMRYAQNTADPTNSIRHLNSWLHVRRVG